MMLRATICLCLWLLVLVSAQAHSPAPLKVQTAGPPDVLLIVSQRPTGGDVLNLTYGTSVPHAQVEKDLAALARETGWALGSPTITDALPSVQPSKRRPLSKMTGVVLTTPQAVQIQSHSFPIDALASAFRGYHRIAVVFWTAPGFVFQGPREYADKNIKVTVTGSGTSYTCQIEILNPNFSALDLPLSQPAPGSARRSPSPVRALLLIVAAAAGTGLAVYLLTARLSRRPVPMEMPLPEEDKQKTPAEERLSEEII